MMHLLSFLVLPVLTTLLHMAGPVIAATADGLTIEVLERVECTRTTKQGDSVSVHYRGSLASDGTQFDASYDRGQPLTFELGKGRVIKGCVLISLYA